MNYICRRHLVYFTVTGITFGYHDGVLVSILHGGLVLRYKTFPNVNF
jgi:hypothetical protein